MDLIEVQRVRSPRSRDELTFGPGELPLGGGTWLFSEPQAGVTGLVDLTSLGWPSIEMTDVALVVSATCTIRDLANLRDRDWAAAPLFWQAANSLLASFKIWNVATVGGNICTSLPAGPMTSLAAALDATALIWGPGYERRQPVAEFVTGVRANTLAPGEVLRAIEFPLAALQQRTAFRRISLSPLGRTGTLVIGRRTPDGVVMTVSGGTTRPWVLTADELDQVDDWYDDAHGSPDWREAMTRLFAREIVEELS
jgi:CO/xanthine dehydrogenase FAD-binding subunit